MFVEDLLTFDLRENFQEFKLNLVNSKKYWIIYLVFIAVIFLSMMGLNNYANPTMELVVFFLCAIFGIVIIAFYSYNFNDKDLYKTAFLIIFLFGILFCFLNPICNVSDEIEHLARADVTSQGILMPEYINNSFKVSDSILHFFAPSRSLSVFQVDADTAKINTTLVPYQSIFQHNPFFGYLPQALGVFLAKLLNLNVIWMLWLGRIANLLFYSFVAAYSVKKSPILKIPLIVMACIPVCLQQAASVSIDGIIAALGILTISYFFYLIKSEDYSIGYKEIIKFLVLCLLLGLCKLPFLALTLLLFCIPRRKFDNTNYSFYIILGIVIVGLIGLLWSKYWAMPNYLHSWRLTYYTTHHVDSTKQIMYMLSHPAQTLVTFFQIPNSLSDSPVLNALSSLYSATPGAPSLNNSGFIPAIIPMFFGAVVFFYPNPDKIDVSVRIKTLFVLIIAYVGVCFSMIISWGAIGNLNDLVVHTRYFLPLLFLAPFIFNMNHVDKRNYELDFYIICLTVGFAASMIIKLTTLYY